MIKFSKGGECERKDELKWKSRTIEKVKKQNIWTTYSKNTTRIESI